MILEEPCSTGRTPPAAGFSTDRLPSDESKTNRLLAAAMEAAGDGAALVASLGADGVRLATGVGLAALNEAVGLSDGAVAASTAVAGPTGGALVAADTGVET